MQNNIKFQEQFRVLIDNKYYRFDFALLNENDGAIRLIEFDGIQHTDNS